MKNFNYTARDKSGSTKRGNLKAVDRNAAMQELSAQGMVTLSITEGANQSQSEGLMLGSRRTRTLLASVAVLIVVALGGWYFFGGSVARSKNHLNRKVAKEPAKKPEKSVSSALTKRPEASISVKTNDIAAMTVEPITKSSTPLADARYGTNRVRSGRAPSRGDGYSSMTERHINMVVNTKLGMKPLPLFKLPKGEDIAKMLQSDIIVYDTDTEKQIEQKANVAKAKEMLKEYLSKGGTTDQFVEYFHGVLEEAAAERSALQQQMFELAKKGDQDATTLFMEEANKTLGAKGYLLLKPTPNMRQK